ncbi:alpha/beta fold hydrolase [Leptospira andrefontaineae]|uniref:Alpha/beta hydrolase n=1 Tax=Leptospira andrefontaineae TaxID=2484976 RepID=A0A4R9GY78_9LEPT|nr:alpha/beta hydrolase [Leptospira andrefontaineae]TGK36648.1 alpha/beta hydrolase [Leptospira andrefontaineae]
MKKDKIKVRNIIFLFFTLIAIITISIYSLNNSISENIAELYKPSADSRFSIVDGIKIHYKRKGEGPIILLLHGNGASLQSFEQVGSALNANSFATVILDLPGFGLTGSREDRDYRIQTYTSTIARFMESLEVQRYSVVGNSLGGNIAWNLALEYPNRVDNLVLINATGYPEKSIPLGIRMAQNPVLKLLLKLWTPRWAVERSLRSAVGSNSNIVNESMVDRIHFFANQSGNRIAFIDLANTDQIDRSSYIKNITVPTLVLRSSKIDGQHFARDIENCRELVNTEGGHLLPEEDPNWVASAISEFMKSSGKRSQIRSSVHL